LNYGVACWNLPSNNNDGFNGGYDGNGVPCLINVYVNGGQTWYDLATTILHELTHCCGTNDLGENKGWGSFSSINAQDVEQCVSLYRWKHGNVLVQ